MFNTSRFNLARFNVLTNANTAVQVRASMVETINAAVMTGENMHIRATGSERVRANISLAIGDMVAMRARESVIAESGLSINFYVRAGMREAVSAWTGLSTNQYIVADMHERLRCTAFLGANFFETFAMREGMSAFASISMDFYIEPLAMWEIIDGQVSSNSFDIAYATFSLTLGPGDELIIDSDHYTVLLNSENAIHLHSGAWLMLERELFDIQIDSGIAGEIEASILYTERYL